mmetsp:Transcript_27740/g.45866  ORF Transcript_27740/g.45866 Transcript_27740/m.45866 type:complete len:331 (+) Transcript_27740:165-1157(+)
MFSFPNQPSTSNFYNFFSKEDDESTLSSHEGSQNRGLSALLFDTSFLPMSSSSSLTSSRDSLPELHDDDCDVELRDALEPVPISSDIQRDDKVSLKSLSQDLLRNASDYCLALKPLEAFCVQDGNNQALSSSFNVTPSFVCHKPSVTPATTDPVHLYDYQQERWMERYMELAKFFNNHGHSDVSNEYDVNLAGWVRRQRHQFKRAKQGRRSTLTVSRVQMLERVGFKWDFHDLAWNENFERLKIFVKIHNHCNVTSSNVSLGSKEENDRLLNWCKRQKRAIRLFLKNKEAVGTRMNAKRFELLQSLGFKWETNKKCPPVSPEGGRKRKCF